MIQRLKASLLIISLVSLISYVLYLRNKYKHISYHAYYKIRIIFRHFILWLGNFILANNSGLTCGTSQKKINKESKIMKKSSMRPTILSLSVRISGFNTRLLLMILSIQVANVDPIPGIY